PNSVVDPENVVAGPGIGIVDSRDIAIVDSLGIED
ncbi:unnamed protein product, partial [Allacma fusca]